MSSSKLVAPALSSDGKEKEVLEGGLLLRLEVPRTYLAALVEEQPW